MDAFELRERIARWENLHTEFKERRIPAEDLAGWLVAFANTDGGQLILGVDDTTRTITGVDDPDEATRFVDNVAYNNCEPPITVLQEVIRVERQETPGKTEQGIRRPESPGDASPFLTVVVVNIPKGDMRPYQTGGGKLYIKTSSGHRSASLAELRRLFQATGSLSYDETSLDRLDPNALDSEAIERYLNATDQGGLKADPRLLHNWGLVAKEHPTVAGIVLFGRQPQQHLPHARVSAVRFPGTDDSLEPLDRKDLGGGLFDVIDQAERFLNLHLYTRHPIRGFEPERHPELDPTALREVVVNSLAHRDYTIPAPVRLFIFDDRIEVHTPGKPPNTVDEGAMRAGVHVVRNPRIYTRLADAGLVTDAGTGVRRIVRLVKEATGQDIRIEISEAEVVFTLPRPRSA
jgi:ATP-dependent DNA helicase RecG